MRSFLMFQFCLMLDLQLHQLTAVVALHSMDFVLQLLIVSSYVLISCSKYDISPFRAFDLPVSQPTAALRSSLPFSLLSLELFSLIALSRSSLCRSFLKRFLNQGIGDVFCLAHLLVSLFQLVLPI